MSQHIKELQKFLEELQTRRDVYLEKAPDIYGRLYKNKNEKDKRPEPFKDSSFLYIRSYNGDIGVRPFSGITHWCSPDINISPITDPGNYQTSLQAGHAYNVNCRLHNRGDITVPYPKVEFFLTDPTLGFDTRFADLIGVTQLPGFLLSGSTDTLNYTYNVPVEASGHKCFFARTYSFSPLDKPFDIYALDPRIDRHIAQKNLNFVPQNTTYQFNLIHLPNSLERIDFVALSQNKVMALQHPGLNNFTIGDKTSPESLRKMQINPTKKVARNLNLKQDDTGFQISAENGKGMDVKSQAAFMKNFNAFLTAINPVNETLKTSIRPRQRHVSQEEKKKMFGVFREMNEPMQQTTFELKIPDFGLKRGQAIGIDIVNTSLVTNSLKGGITLLVTG